MKLFNKVAAIAVGVMLATGVGVGVAVGFDVSSKRAIPTNAATVGTNLNQVTSLTSGNQYVILGANAAYALPTNPTVSSGKITGTAVASVPNNGTGYLWTFTKSGNYWLIGDGSKYVYHSNGGNSGTNLSYGTNQESFPWSLTYEDGSWTFAGVNNGTVKTRGMLANGSTFGGYSLSNADSYGAMGIYEVVSVTTYTVSFNGNGGTGSMSNVTGVSGSYTLPANGFTAPSNKAFAGWKAGNAGDLIAVGGTYNVTANVTFYAQWANAYTVTYTAGANGSGSYAHTLQPAGSYTLLDFANLTGVSANSGYRFANYTVNGVDKDPGDVITLSAATEVTVNFEIKPEETTYVFADNFTTYANGWTTTYGEKTLQGTTDVGGDYAATIVLGRANKQNSGTVPTLAAAKNTTVDNMIVFTLTETGYKIKAVTVTFTQRSSNTPTLNLFKGSDTTASGITALDSATIGTKSTLSVASLNDTSFSVNCIASGTSNNCSVDLSSIYISIEAQAAYGTTDHIKVTGMPRTVYHIGEVYDSTGLAVTAYDGADESTANFKDVTEDALTGFGNGYIFQDTDVPTAEMFVEYKESGTTFAADPIIMHVYALAEYELVESAPADWSGNYLIVATDGDSNLVAMNGGLANPDVEGGYQVVTEKSTGIIEAGQENEWTIASYSTGYSIQGKSGKYIGRGTDSNGMDVSDSALLNTLAFADGEVTVSGSSTGRKLSFNTTGNRFRYYSSGTVKLYKLVESSNADAYAQTFLGAFTCNAAGTSQPTFTLKEAPSTYWSWSLLATEYNTLTAAEKEEFRLGVASETGTNIEKALARYDYIVGKYNKGQGITSYTDFMNRNPAKIGASRSLNMFNEEAGTAATMVVVVVSAISVTAIGGFFLLKKKPF